MAISQITEYDKCCGCSVCESICPKHCITMVPNNEGFLYPKINKENCIECQLCIKTCPINKSPYNLNEDFNQKVYACKNKDIKALRRSSSGGVFFELAQYVLTKKGIVFGVIYKDKTTIFTTAETYEELLPMLGSKYVQSNKRFIWPKVKQELKNDRLVLFTGTPCEIGALKNFLKRDYENLICAEVMCMGVPSPIVFSKHLDDLEKKYHSRITQINCRSKEYGAFTHSLTLKFENGKKYFRAQYAEPFIKNFHSRLFLRKSCHNCSYKKEHRDSDITMADFWGIENTNIPILEKDGVSMIIIHSQKGEDIFNLIKDKFEYYPTTMEVAKKHQPMMTQSCTPSSLREQFFEELKQKPDKSFAQIINKYNPITAKDVLRSKLKELRWLRNIIQNNKQK